MRIFKKAVSVTLAFILFFTGLPDIFLNLNLIPKAYAAESTVDLHYDDFSNTESLQLNGSDLIENNAINFESTGGAGESVLTTEKITLSSDLSFSTAFTFKNTTPASPTIGHERSGFIFTLQPVGNSTVPASFQDDSLSPSFCVALNVEYLAPRTARSLGGMHYAAAGSLLLADASESTMCVIHASAYRNGNSEASVLTHWFDSYYIKDEPSGDYKVWIGYNGAELKILTLDPWGVYRYDEGTIDFDGLPNALYAGFMGSIGNAGNTVEIKNWYFKNDVSILEEAIAQAEIDQLNADMEVMEAAPVYDFYLPLEGMFGGTIDWVADKPAMLTAEGASVPPTLEQGNQTVTLTGTITRASGVRAIGPFTITLKVPYELIHAANEAWLTSDVIRKANDRLDNILTDLHLPVTGLYGSTIEWSSNNTTVVNWDGRVTRPIFSEGDQTVILDACINVDEFISVKTFNLTVKALGMTDEDYVQADYLWLTGDQLLNGNSALTHVTTDLSLPGTGHYGSGITWESSDAVVVDTDGKVTRPTFTSGDKTITLTAAITRGTFSTAKPFTVTVVRLEKNAAERLAADSAWLTEVQLLNGSSAMNNVTGDLSLPVAGPDGSTITWESTNVAAVNNSGIVTRPSYTVGDQTITLTATLENGSTVTKAFTVTVKALEKNAAERLAADSAWLTEAQLLNGNTAMDNILGDLSLPVAGPDGSTITWASSNAAVVNENGDVTRPSFTVGDQIVTLTATLENGSTVTKAFAVTVKALEINAAERLAADSAWLTEMLLLNGSSAMNNITGDLSLPTIGPGGSTITWASTNVAAVNNSGIVTRPSFTVGDQTVTLTATLENGSTVTKAFTVTVKALEQTAAEKLAADSTWLTEAQLLNGNTAMHNILGNLSLPSLGPDGSTITWASTNIAAVNNSGIVTRPSFTVGDQIVTLTATLTNGSSTTKAFTVTVKALEQTAAEKLAADSTWLTEAQLLNGNTAMHNILGNLSLPVAGPDGSIITWDSTNVAAVNNSGIVTRESYTVGDQIVTLTATLENGSTVTKAFTVTVKALEKNAAERLAADSTWLTEAQLLNGSSAMNNITGNLSLPAVGPDGSTITWASTNIAAVNENGIVTRESYTVGDQIVTLTATLTNGSSTTKAFTVTVKALEQTAAEKLAADSAWLTEAQLLNGNTAFNSITRNLSLPVTGPNGSTISWAASNTTVVSNAGIVTRPSFTAGDQTVTLTATISMGLTAPIEKVFTVTVLKLNQSHQEKVDADMLWLTVAQILNGNNALDDITKDLNLPSRGENGSYITWNSPFPNVIGVNGKVTRPSFTTGSKTVTIQATISLGTAAPALKSFEMTVRALDMNDLEATALDLEWLSTVPVLAENPTANSVTKNLNHPVTAPFGSTITWVSDKPGVIANNGTVTQPENGSGHQAVKLTATISRGTAQRQKTYTYVVLEKPDTTAPQVLSTVPAGGSTLVSWDTKAITILFSENIVKGEAAKDQTLGIKLQSAENVRMGVTISEKSIILSPYSILTPGENKVTIPTGAVADSSGNQAAAYEFTFIVEPWPVRTIAVVATTPQDLEQEADILVSKKIHIRFDASDLQAVFEKRPVLTDKSTGFEALTGRSLQGDQLTLTALEISPGTVYELFIPAGAVKDRFGNTNEEKRIRFKTKSPSGKQLVVGTTPANGQTGVNIYNASIEFLFTQEERYYGKKLLVNDDKGNQYVFNAQPTADRKKLRFISAAFSRYQPNTVYTVTAPYATVENPNQLEFSLQFKTSDNGLLLQDTAPRANKMEVPLDTKVEMTFNSAIEMGSTFDAVTIKDSGGTAVAFTAQGVDNRAILTPGSALKPFELYTVTIPEGAFQGDGGTKNDGFRFSFRTVNTLNINPNHIVVPEVGFAGKHSLFELTEAVNLARSKGRRFTSIQWKVAGQEVSTKEWFYQYFKEAGTYPVELVLKDNMGYTYQFSKEIEIQDLTQIRMDFADTDHGLLREVFVNTAGGEQIGLDYDLKLVQAGQLINGERITAALYRNGVLQRHIPGPPFVYMDTIYQFTFYPQPGEFGTYELVFSYEGKGKKQELRAPVNLFSFVQPRTREFKFRLYDIDTKAYYEGAESLLVFLNGQKLQAVKRWYPEHNYYAYAIEQALDANVHYEFQTESAWALAYKNQTVYVAKDSSEAVVISGRPMKPGSMKHISINTAESAVKDPFTELFFEGVSAKLVLNVQGDWKNAVPGYYEIKTWESDRFSLKVNCVNGNEVQKIVLDPGLQLKAGEQLLIRMVSKHGVATGWNYCPLINVVPMPSLLGKKLSITLQNGEYAVNWPYVFGGFMGERIGALDGIPVVDGANFGIGSGMPKFEGMLEGNYYWPYVELTFGAIGGYGETDKTSIATKKHKKLKKVTAVGYELEIEVEGGMRIDYNTQSEEWRMNYLYFTLLGEATREWTKGYEFMGVGFSAGVGVGAEVYGALRVDREEDENQYSGIVGLGPTAFLSVHGDFKVARVDGYLTARMPAFVHFPTGYIGVDINLNANIYAQALLWGKTIYEKRLWGTHWDNGKKKVVIKSMQDDLNIFAMDEAVPFEVLPREYASRQSSWLAGDQPLNPEWNRSVLASLNSLDLPEGSQENPKIDTLLENIYPNTEVQLVRNGDELWLVWSDDNPERDAVNRTQLRSSVLKEGTWSEPIWLDDDGTADFAPAVAAAGNGVLMAWHNIAKVVTEEDGLTGMLENSEISVTDNIFAADTLSPTILTLTNDDAIDHSPRLAAQDNKALLVWTKSQSLGFSLDEEAESAPPNGDQLFYSTWSNGTWSTPEPIGDTSYTVLDSSLAMTGETGLLLYTLDMDNDLATGEDREVFARLCSENAWSEAIRLTNNTTADFAPKAVHVNGEWFITWVQDGRLAYQTGVNGEMIIEARLTGIQSNYELRANSGSLISLVNLQPGEDMAVGVAACFYDTQLKQWGNPVSMAASPVAHTKAASAVFAEDGTLKVIIPQAEIVKEAIPELIDGEEQLVEQPVVTDKVDLKLLTYRPVHDLAVSEHEGITLSTQFPLPNTLTTVYVTLHNEGDFSENARVQLYDGDPKGGGELIGEAPSKLLPARSSMEAEVEWLVGSEEKNTYHLFAVVQSADGEQEYNTQNNAVDVEFSVADIAITALDCVNAARDDYLVNVTVANTGSVRLAETTAVIENVSDGRILETITVDSLEPGKKTVLTKLFSEANLTQDGSGQITLRVRVNAPDGVQEAFAGNNSRSFTLEPAEIKAISMSPGPGDKHVDPSAVLSLDFNMPISEGAGFGSIRLLDASLNQVALNKGLAASTLTLTPQTVLEKNTEYTLIIPSDALGDAYGHALKKPLSFSFTTVSSHPEVVSAYPGAFMENAPINTDIRLKFNQKVTGGIDYQEISLFGPDDERIPVTASLKGDSLLLNYAGRLAENSMYSLEVPMRAVTNAEQETMLEDYMLAFSTGTDVQDKPARNEDEEEEPLPPGNAQGGGYEAEVEIGGTRSAVKVTMQAKKAVIALDAEALKDRPNAVVGIPAIPGAGSYSVEMPAEALKSGKISVTVNTALGSVDIPQGMLSELEGLSGKTFGLTIANADRNALPEAVRAAVGDRPMLRITVTLDGEETTWSNPKAPVRVSIPYTPTSAELENPESIIIWYIDSKGNLITVPNGVYDPSTGTVSFMTAHLSDFAVGFNRVSFQDVVSSAWYGKAVSLTAARGITKGTGKNLFSPGNRLTRAEVVVMVLRAYGIEPDIRPEDNFTDAGDTWYTGYLAAARRLGISKGVGNNRFAPDKEITRQELFTLLYNALKAIGQLPVMQENTDVIPVRLSDFTDEQQIASWAKEAMTVLVETRMVNGTGGGLAPLDTSTRAEMAQMLYNLMSSQ